MAEAIVFSGKHAAVHATRAGVDAVRNGYAYGFKVTRQGKELALLTLFTRD